MAGRAPPHSVSMTFRRRSMPQRYHRCALLSCLPGSQYHHRECARQSLSHPERVTQMCRDFSTHLPTAYRATHGLQCSSLTRVSVEKTFSLQRRDILHHGRLAGEPEVILNLARARCKTLFALLVLNKIKHAPLPLGQHEESSFRSLHDASSNEHFDISLGRASSPPHAAGRYKREAARSHAPYQASKPKELRSKRVTAAPDRPGIGTTGKSSHARNTSRRPSQFA